MFDSVKENFLDIKRALFIKLYDKLNKEQAEAVLTVNGPLLVLAGAGTGKTTVLVNRIAHIIRYGNAYESEAVPENIDESKICELKAALSLSKEEIADVLNDFITEPCPPWAILCITFTNKAANEMKERLSNLIGSEYSEQIWAGTFHSICVRLLRKYGQSIGYESNFTIYDSDDSKRLILSCLKELNIDDKSLQPKTAQNKISSLKNQLKTLMKFLMNSQKKVWVWVTF
jgi:DNA helicase-2/ATP-dependent DNA helicase PcrA